MKEPPVHLPNAIADLVGSVEVRRMELFRTRLELRHPLKTAGGEIDAREVIHVRIVADAGGVECVGWGEAAPLRWWGSEKLEHAEFDLGRLRDAVEAGRELNGDAAVAMMRPPTARFAVQSALLDVAAQARGVPIRRLFASHPPNEISLNATIGLVTPEEAFRAAAEAVDQGFETIKVKIGADGDADDARLAAVGRAAPDARLRLDANGAWGVSEALSRIERLGGMNVEYLEQPVAADDLEALRTVARTASVPIAADESCLPLERARALLEDGSVSVLVLKPSLLGAWSDVMELVEKATNTGTKVVFTSAVDSAIARAVVAQFATLLGPVACGLATGSWLKNDVAREDFVAEGKLFLGSGNGIGFRPRLAGGTS